jgi:hypothetical protein
LVVVASVVKVVVVEAHLLPVNMDHREVGSTRATQADVQTSAIHVPVNSDRHVNCLRKTRRKKSKKKKKKT